MAQIATISLPGRRVTPTVHVKWGNTDIAMGSGHPIVVQSMANTLTADVEQTVAQVLELARAGSELVRRSAPARSLNTGSTRETSARVTRRTNISVRWWKWRSARISLSASA